ncbi:DnaJ-domain-containing protein [Xylaria intraflava]|nr:DnaJ-domain-containing protein [Xylaria intraflava]
MPARSAASLLAAPAPLRRRCPRLTGPKSIAFTGTQRSRLLTAITCRLFCRTSPRRDDAIDNARNHYETLKLTPSATASEIKKSFYSLSKAHHPDVQDHPKRRAAAKRFMRISEAYSILSSPTKRAKYDRDHMHLAQASASTPAPHPQRRGSYASTGPAGGRPASGLSRRRGTFQGPPPSFFRGGGWGASWEKRQAAHEGTASGPGPGQNPPPNPGPGPGPGGKGPLGGMGPGQDPFGHGGEVPHFDREGHEASWRRAERRREARRGDERPVEPERGVLGMFFFIGGILVFISFVGPFVFSRVWFGGAPRTREGRDREVGKG